MIKERLYKHYLVKILNLKFFIYQDINNTWEKLPEFLTQLNIFNKPTKVSKTRVRHNKNLK